MKCGNSSTKTKRECRADAPRPRFAFPARLRRHHLRAGPNPRLARCSSLHSLVRILPTLRSTHPTLDRPREGTEAGDAQERGWRSRLLLVLVGVSWLGGGKQVVRLFWRSSDRAREGGRQAGRQTDRRG